MLLLAAAAAAAAAATMMMLLLLLPCAMWCCCMHANAAAAAIILLLPPLPLLVVTMLVVCLLRRCPSVLRRILLQPALAFTCPPQNERNHSRPTALTSPNSNVFALVSRTRARRCHHSRRRRLLQVPSQKPSSQPQSTDISPPQRHLCTRVCRIVDRKGQVRV